MRVIFILFLLLVTPAYASVKTLGTVTAGPGIEPSKTKMLLTVGDSITAGVGGDGDGDAGNDWGYRQKLQDILGIGTYRFVGSVNRPSSDATYDVANWGNSGQIIAWMVSHTGPVDGIKYELNRSFTNSTIDSVVLIHAATNDIILQSIDDVNKKTNAQLIASMNQLIDAVLDFNPNAKIYVALIVPLRQSDQATWWQPFHDDLLAAMTTRRATNPNVHTVDMYYAFLYDYTGDCAGDWYNNCLNVFSGAHPSATGYLVMAKMWARCMNDNTAIGCDGH